MQHQFKATHNLMAKICHFCFYQKLIQLLIQILQSHSVVIREEAEGWNLQLSTKTSLIYLSFKTVFLDIFVIVVWEILKIKYSISCFFKAMPSPCSCPWWSQAKLFSQSPFPWPHLQSTALSPSSLSYGNLPYIIFSILTMT